MEFFRHLKDYFHLRLPIQKLSDLGEYEEALNILSERGIRNEEVFHNQ